VIRYRLPAVFAAALIAACSAALPGHDVPVIALIGDSTVTDEKGWGLAFAEMFSGKAIVHNFAVGGRSAKSFTDENRLAEALAASPDYVFIQFGHNGQPGKGAYRETNPEGSYRDYLRAFVVEIRASGAEPVIVSSLTRRNFGDDNRIESTLGPWADGAKAVSKELEVPFVDLHAASIEFHNRIGPAQSALFNPEPDDRTHLNPEGAKAIATLILDGLAAIRHPLAALLSEDRGY